MTTEKKTNTLKNIFKDLNATEEMKYLYFPRGEKYIVEVTKADGLE